jgi:hypothetical protein
VTADREGGQRRVDVKALVEELKVEVARKRAAGELPAELFLKGDPDSLDPEMRDDLDANLRRANETALLARREDLGSGAAAFLKRMIRKLVLFHTDFLAHQIDRHNAAVVRVLNRYRRALDELAWRAAKGDDVAGKFGERLADLENARLVERLEAIERALREQGTLRG